MNISDKKGGVFSFQLDNERTLPNINFMGIILAEYTYPNDYEFINEFEEKTKKEDISNIKTFTLYQITYGNYPAYLVVKKESVSKGVKFILYNSWEDLMTLNRIKNEFFDRFKFEFDYPLLSKLIKRSDLEFQISLKEFLTR